MPSILDGRIKGKQNGKISIEMTVANISLYIKKNDMAPLSRSHLRRILTSDRFVGGRSSRVFLLEVFDFDPESRYFNADLNLCHGT